MAKVIIISGYKESKDDDRIIQSILVSQLLQLN
jgi:hypothetical protein